MIEGRKDIHIVLFFLQVFSEVLTSTLVVLFRIFSEHVGIIYIVFISLSVPRVGYWIFISWKLAGRLMLDCFIMLDSLLVLAFITWLSFVGYNTMMPSKHQGLLIGEMICFFLLLYCYNGVFRVLIKHMRWTRARSIVYKANRMFSVVFYMIYAILEVRRLVFSHIEDTKDMYLIYIFTSIVYLSDIFLIINERDKVRELNTAYVIGAEQTESHTETGLLHH